MTRQGQDELMRRMWAAGKSATEIAKAIGVTRNVVLVRIRQAGLTQHRSTTTPCGGCGKTTRCR